jgi:histone H3/H4
MWRCEIMAKTELPIAPLVRIVKNAGVERISEDAKETLAKTVEASVTALATKANSYAKHAGRKTITADDIKLAKQDICK